MPVYYEVRLEVRKKPGIWLSASDVKWRMVDEELEARSVQILNGVEEEKEVRLEYNRSLMQVSLDKARGRVRVRPLARRPFSEFIRFYMVRDGSEEFAGVLKISVVP
jgi:hypothetical protein